jgi:hypothetical protein
MMEMQISAAVNELESNQFHQPYSRWIPTSSCLLFILIWLFLSRLRYLWEKLRTGLGGSAPCLGPSELHCSIAPGLFLLAGVCAHLLRPAAANGLVPLHPPRPQTAGRQGPEAGSPAQPSHGRQGYLIGGQLVRTFAQLRNAIPPTAIGSAESNVD